MTSSSAGPGARAPSLEINTLVLGGENQDEMGVRVSAAGALRACLGGGDG